MSGLIHFAEADGFNRRPVSAAAPLPVDSGLAGFDLTVAPTVTSGAYSAGDIVGGLIELEVARANGALALIQDVQVTLKAGVQPNLRLILFSADPTATTKADNEAYSLNAADAFKVRKTLTLSGGWTAHGTPRTNSLGNVGLAFRPAPDSRKLFVLVVDDTGVTLTSTGDMQVRVAGVQG